MHNWIDVVRWNAWFLIETAAFWKLRNIPTKEWAFLFPCVLLALFGCLFEIGFLRVLSQRKRFRRLMEKARARSKPESSSERARLRLENLALRTAGWRHDDNLRFGALGLLIVLALLIFYLPLPSYGVRAVQQASVTIQFSPETKADISNLLNKTCPSCSGVCPQSTAFPQPTPGPEKQLARDSSRPIVRGWAIVLLGVVALLAIGAVISRRPETAPIVLAGGVVEFAREAVKNAEHLARLPWWLFLPIVIAFLIIAVGFLIKGYRVIELESRADMYKVPNTDKNTDQENPAAKPAIRSLLGRLMGGGEKPSRGNLFLTIGFSILVLAWIIVLVSYQPTPAARETPPKPTPPPPSPTSTPPQTVSLAAQNLRGPTFDRGDGDHPKQLEDLQSTLTKEAKPGDLLLLLGSADCTRYTEGNDFLASKRAKMIRNSLESGMNAKGVRIALGNLPQHASCRESAESRAVIPFLVHLGRETSGK